MNRWFAVLALVLVGCGGGDAPVPDAEATDGSSLETGRIEGTPTGGLGDWLSDIEAGLPLMDDVVTNRRLTQRGVIELYVGRQEYIEMYWGPSGRLQGEGGASLAAGVTELESAFHEFMQSLLAQPLDTVRVRSAMDAVQSRVADVRRRGAESGLPLVPSGNPVRTHG